MFQNLVEYNLHNYCLYFSVYPCNAASYLMGLIMYLKLTTSRGCQYLNLAESIHIVISMLKYRGCGPPAYLPQPEYIGRWQKADRGAYIPALSSLV